MAVLEDTILRGPGVTSPEARAAAAAGTGEGPVSDYARLIHRAAYEVTTEQVAELNKANSDDALFELTVAASFGEAKRRHDAGIAALDAAWSES
ncbi:MAG: hypothetical protein ACO1OB_26710 [Archangium sp.]